MNIKSRLSFQFSILVTGILLFFSVLVYYFSYSSQIRKFRQDLLDSAKNTAILLINLDEVDSSLLKKIHQSTISWEREEIAVTDSSFHLLYGYNIQYLTDEVIQTSGKYANLKYFSFEEKDGVYYKHNFNNRTYNVFVMAFDKSRIEDLSELRNVLLLSILFSVCLSILLSYFFSREALQPISHIIRSVKDLNSFKLGDRLDEGNRKDEIAQLAITFNELLEDLETVFKNQEDFVSNASHELRTPLSIMISESDYLLRHRRNEEEYISHITGLVEDLKKLNVLSNSLLELAQIQRDRSFPLLPVRIDEIILNAILQVKNKHEDRKIIPKIQYPENASDLLISGNSGLLEIAFKNLLDNACKFSNDVVDVELLIKDNIIIVRISDKGLGIPENEMESIFMPFKRASNVKYVGGHGIGLALVAKIFELHESSLQIKSVENEGTSVEIQINRYRRFI